MTIAKQPIAKSIATLTAIDDTLNKSVVNTADDNAIPLEESIASALSFAFWTATYPSRARARSSRSAFVNT